MVFEIVTLIVFAHLLIMVGTRGKSRYCEICGVKESVRGGFYASFPIDELRCRNWVQLVGKEDLVHVPIEKLHELRHVCSDHFERRDFGKTGKRLKKRACPKLHPNAPPLSDHQLREFPQHVNSKAGEDKVILHKFPNPKTDPIIFRTWTSAVGGNTLVLDDDYVHNYRRVCRVHFEKSYWFGNKLLSNIAVPTLQLKERSTEVTEEATEEPSASDGDDVAPPSPVPEVEAEAAGPLFSWQSELIPAVDVEDPPTELEEQSGVSLYCDDTPAPPVVPQVPETSVKEVEYRCKDCGEIIDGFQFWCVQCFGSALCGACEARGTHKRHYVLRAPPHRPYRQTQVVLATIRHQLQNENMLTQLGTDDDGVKLEMKEEPPEEDCNIVNTAAEDDPLDAADPLRHEPASDEPRHTIATEETTHRPFKRPRLADYIERGFATRGVPHQVKVTSRSEPILNLDDVDDQVEYVTEELETDDEVRDDEYTEIETLDDDLDSFDSSVQDDDSIDSRVIEDDADSIDSSIVEDDETDVVTRINETDSVDHRIVKEAESVLSDLAARLRREETGKSTARGSPESMVRTLSSEAVVELRPLSCVEIRKWTADSKKRRK